MKARTVRRHFRKPAEAAAWLADMNERNLNFAAAARLYRQAGDIKAAERCEQYEATKHKIK